MTYRGYISIAFLLSLLFAACPGLRAQSTYGSVTGAVTDPSGAAIPSAQVTLTNLGTAETRTQTTGPAGDYSFVNLIPGNYRLVVTKTGFMVFRREPIVVEVQQSTRADATMQLGAVTQEVTVTAATPLLQPETSSLGEVVTQRPTTELPLNGRNIFNLTAIAPSVVLQGSTYGTPVTKNPFDYANFQVGGSFANQAVEYWDGQPLNIGYINLPIVLPTQDAIGEFKVQYNNLGPEWGKFSGGVLNLSTRSGTNTWHGTVYEYARNKVLNANTFFANAAGIPVPPFTQNQFGAAAGGRVIKDKLFVFGSWESFRLRQGQVVTTTLPTVAERGGDFSALCKTGFTAGLCNDGKDAAGNPIDQIYDPLSVNLTTGSPLRTAFPNNNISTLINPTSQYLLTTLFPDPTNSALTNNFVKATSIGGDSNEVVLRPDWTIGAKQRLFARVAYWNLLDLPTDPFGTGLCMDRCSEKYHTKALAIGYTNTLTPTTILNVNLSGSRFVYLRTPKNDDFDMTKEGYPAAYNSEVPDLERTPLTPVLGIDDPTVSATQGQSAISDHDIQYNLSPSLSWVHGPHTFVFGAQFELSLDNYLQTNTGGGLIAFNGTWTEDQAEGLGNPLTGKDFADFLLGYGLGAGTPLGNQASGSAIISAPIAGRMFYQGYYAGDTWKVTRKLTLNLGIRFDLAGQWTERFNRLSYFNPSATNLTVTGCSGTAGSPCLGDLFLVGTGVNTSNHSLPSDNHEVMPRIGLAYSFNPQTVVRAGYGVFFIPNWVDFGTHPYADNLNSSTSPYFVGNNGAFYPTATINASVCALVAADNLKCTEPGPFGTAGTLTVPPGRNVNPSTYALALQSFSANDYVGQKYGYVQQYNIDFERQLPAGFFLDAAYAGATGIHLPNYNPNIDQIPDSFVSQAAAQAASGQPITIAQVVPTSSYPFSPALTGSLAPGNLKYGQLDRRFPEYTGLNMNSLACCTSSYQSFQLTVQRRFAGGGTLVAAYTNEKLLTDTDELTSWLETVDGGVGVPQDWNNLKGERSLSSQDVSQRLVISYALDLPFGHGKRWGSSLTGAPGKLASGWGIDGVTTFQRGFPLKIIYGGSTPFAALGDIGLATTLRPNYVAGCDKAAPSGSRGAMVQEWFNTACFTAPPDWGYGTEPRSDPSLRQDGINNFDFAVFKSTNFGPSERMGIQFRAEFFNLFNRPQFGPPNTTVVSPVFGSVTSTVGNPRLVQFGLKFLF
jgi:hypothetical protein